EARAGRAAAVVAGPLLAGGAPGKIVATDRCQRRATGAAAGQAGEQVLGPAVLPELAGPRLRDPGAAADGAQPALHGLPEILVDDAQLGYRLHDPLPLRVEPQPP